MEGLEQGVNEAQDTVVVQGKGSRCQSQRGLTFALILIEETETQSSNVMLGGRAEDQSSPQASLLPRTQNTVLKQAYVPPALTDEGREKENTCELGCSLGYTPKPSPEDALIEPRAPTLFCSLTSLVPPAHLYSADTLEPLDHLTILRQISTMSQHRALNIQTG